MNDQLVSAAQAAYTKKINVPKYNATDQAGVPLDQLYGKTGYGKKY